MKDNLWHIFKSLSLFISLQFSNLLFAQENKVAMKELKTNAEENFKIGNFREALNYYERLNNYKPGDADINYSLGYCYLRSNLKKEKAIEYLEFANEFGKRLPHELKLDLASLYHFTGRFDEAFVFYEEYLKTAKPDGSTAEEVKLKMLMCENAKAMVASPVYAVVINLGENVNSDYSDYAPVITADQQEIYFSSRRRGSTGGFIDVGGEFFADIYFTTRKKDEWYKVKNIGKMINSDMSETTICLSPDEQQLLIAVEEYASLTTDFYYSPRRGKTWFKLEIFGSKNIDIDTDVNSRSSETGATFSPDGLTLFFSSDRKTGSFGGFDIWQSKKLPNGEWGLALNLGPNINTKHDENTPFIHTDGKTLYFSNNGPKSMGGYDIFKSVLNEFGEWGEPQNLGYPVNSTDDDLYFNLTLDEKSGYFSSVRPSGFGNSDLYMAKMPKPEGITDFPVVYKSKIGYFYIDTSHINLDSLKEANSHDSLFSSKLDSIVPIAATITVYETETNNTIGIYRSNAVTGNFIMILYPNKNYKLTINPEGFENYTEELFVKPTDDWYEVQVIKKNIILPVSSKIGDNTQDKK